jgi:thymidylate synthase
MNNISSSDFNTIYPRINSWVLSNGTESESRNGKVKKVREFVTRLSEPERNLVGGWGRRINPFFLFVEAVWIWLGRQDVAPLIPFNSRMADYSDDGRIFHAPYGHRLRVAFGEDQFNSAIEMLSSDSSTRRVVMQIWDARLDLGSGVKDIPCNDTIAVCIDEEDKLRFSIFNRSNDLHWGLPTNVYQFSFIGKLIANCLGIEYGHQTHFSNDLHIYLDNPLVEGIEKNYNDWEGMFSGFESIYEFCQPIDIKFDFQLEPLANLNLVDSTLKHYFSFIEKGADCATFINILKHPPYINNGFIFMVASCLFYIETKSLEQPYENKESQNIYNLKNLISLSEHYKQSYTDFSLLTVNFFASRLRDKTVLPSILREYGCDEEVKQYIGYL